MRQCLAPQNPVTLRSSRHRSGSGRHIGENATLDFDLTKQLPVSAPLYKHEPEPFLELAGINGPCRRRSDRQMPRVDDFDETIETANKGKTTPYSEQTPDLSYYNFAEAALRLADAQYKEAHFVDFSTRHFAFCGFRRDRQDTDAAKACPIPGRISSRCAPTAAG